MTSAYHPQANGLVERFNQTLTEALVKKCHDNQQHWDEHIDSVLFAYRTSVQKSTKMTPFFLMHLREANLGDVGASQPLQQDDVVAMEQKVNELIKIKAKVDELVDHNIKVCGAIIVHVNFNNWIYTVHCLYGFSKFTLLSHFVVNNSCIAHMIIMQTQSF